MIFHRVDGPVEAPVVVLSNSLGTSHGMWDAQLPSLARHFRVLRYDTRGHGASHVPPGPYDMAALGRDVVGLLDTAGIQRASFCGLSLGGMTGMWLAAHAPQRVDRLVLCNTSSCMGAPEAWNTRIEAVLRGGMAAVTEGVIERWFTPEFRAAEPAAVEHIRQMLLTTSPEGYVACAAAVRDMDLRDDLASISAPTLVVSGTRDPATPPEHLRFIADRVRGARLVQLPTAHLSNIGAQLAFTRTLTDFLLGR